MFLILAFMEVKEIYQLSKTINTIEDFLLQMKLGSLKNLIMFQKLRLKGLRMCTRKLIITVSTSISIFWIQWLHFQLTYPYSIIYKQANVLNLPKTCSLLRCLNLFQISIFILKTITMIFHLQVSCSYKFKIVKMRTQTRTQKRTQHQQTFQKLQKRKRGFTLKLN